MRHLLWQTVRREREKRRNHSNLGKTEESEMKRFAHVQTERREESISEIEI
jgi:hypothetical protein